ncbi:hypothetical protein [Nesterenkonia sp. Act20]|uniref:hypothetical protein n=1 Tax=Nesterenkonia sp. Act20 TaxID=1483432 RepID=UPI001C44D4DC|nr:hypothetical protein [Nesterenkonia sp. Act20]
MTISAATGLALAVAVLLGIRPDRRTVTVRWPGRFREAVARRVSRRAGRQHTAERLRSEAGQLLRQYAALLQSGRSQPQAWADLSAHWRSRTPGHPLAEVCAQASAAEQAGLGAVVGLRRALQTSSSPEDLRETEVLREVLVALISLHALSQTTGAPLSELCRRAAGALDEATALHAAIRTAAAGPRLTQLLLTLLPAGGLGMGMLMGASPLTVLLGTPWGAGALLMGTAMLVLGRCWSSRLIRSVSQHV